MNCELAAELMTQFAEDTGLVEPVPPRRYLWTDAFAVCNFLGLADTDSRARFEQLALRLVDQVHETLGRHREDDRRTGWISGLGEQEGRDHPTAGGLRIGKPEPERDPGEPMDPHREWDRDGQYFHYLTRWMHALCRTAEETGRGDYLRWAQELALTAHRAFTFPGPGGNRMVWKMSIDLSRPLVPTMGHHDPLDALVTYLDLQAAGQNPALDGPIAEASAMCEGRNWATDDPLGIGGLLMTASRLARVVFQGAADRRALLEKLCGEAALSLNQFEQVFSPQTGPTYRLAFRELGLVIGLEAIASARALGPNDPAWQSCAEAVLSYRGLGKTIEEFWMDPANRKAKSWTAHQDINAVMLATSLCPAGFLGMTPATG